MKDGAPTDSSCQSIEPSKGDDGAKEVGMSVDS